MEATALQLERILQDLNPQQCEAVKHGRDPLLIVAGAGTGKTTTLAHRVAALIASGVDPRRILLLTFTRRAAAEMLRRVDSLLARVSEAADAPTRQSANAENARIWGGTFHSVATRLLRRYGKSVGLDADFTILDRSDSEELLNVLRTELQLAKGESRFPLKGTCLDIYSKSVNTQLPLEPLLERDFPWCREHGEALAKLFSAYVDRKESAAILDYDDLLLFWHALVTDESAAATIRGLFDYVLVDEYQDTNTLQSEILRGLRPDGQGVTVVGDDAQSIYSFRAATVRNILDFPKQFPNVRVIKLEQNYRSTQPILAATNAVIAESNERHEKELWSLQAEGEPPVIVDCYDEDEQTDFVVQQVLEHRERGVLLQNQAVLFRASHHSLGLEVELGRRNIPFHKYGGLKFVETAHVKDLMAFLRLAENPRDIVAGMRVLMLLPGIGAKKAGQLMEVLTKAGGDFATWKQLLPPAAAQTHWPLFVALMQILARRGDARQGVPADINAVRTFYAPLLEQKYDHARARLQDLRQLEEVAGRFNDRAAFLEELALDPPSSTQELPSDPWLDEDFLILSTIHSAKGLEWDAVYVLHAADGNIPSDMATGSSEEIDEERRLFYVACSRAKSSLYVCFPQRYHFHNRHRSDAHSLAKITRFLSDATRPLFTRRPASTVQSESREDFETSLNTSAIRSRIKNLWK